MLANEVSHESTGPPPADAQQILEIAIVDDDVCVRESMVGLIESIGYDVRFFESAEELLGYPCLGRVGCLILDVRLPEMSGIELYFRLRVRNRHIPTIFMTAHVDAIARTQALEAGAVAFLYKPFRIDALLDAAKIAIGSSRYRRLNTSSAKTSEQEHAITGVQVMSFAATARFNDFRPNRTEEGLGLVTNDSEHSMEPDETGIVGNSPALQNALAQARIVAPTDSTVVIYGETGTGKELFARLLHNLSGRRHRPFVGVNCAAIPEELLESELFGHERGAFTGAVTQRIGRFEAADKGTLFLDEIGDLPLGLQAKLLRVLQEQEFERLGSTRTVRVDVRVVAATNQDLAQLIDDRQFRSDLFYRLHVFPIALPPLRERREDIPLLVRHCVNNAANRVQRPITSIPAEAMKAMMGYDWPGNIRELQNFIECAVILSEDGVLRIPPLGPKETRTEIRQAVVTLRDLEREHIQWMLERTGWVIGGADGAAIRLGLPRTTLIAKMKRLAIPQRGKRLAAEESKIPYATTELERRCDIARD